MKYRDLIVWNKSIQLVEFIYKITEKLNAEEKYGLKSQIRRAAVSIPSNIAEGHGRKHTKAFINHLSIAFGSLMEVETLTEISKKLNYMTEKKSKEIFMMSELIGKMISGLKKSLKSKLNIKNNASKFTQSSIHNPNSSRP